MKNSMKHTQKCFLDNRNVIRNFVNHFISFQIELCTYCLIKVAVELHVTLLHQ